MRREVQEVRRLESARERERELKLQATIDQAVTAAVDDMKQRHEREMADEATRLDAHWQNKITLEGSAHQDELRRLAEQMLDKDSKMAALLGRVNALEEKAHALTAAE